MMGEGLLVTKGLVLMMFLQNGSQPVTIAKNTGEIAGADALRYLTYCAAG